MPTFLRRLRAHLKYWNHAEHLKRELDVHRAMIEDDARGAGAVAPSEARRHAARLIGNDTIAREDARAVWIARWIEQLLQDVRYGLRSLAARPAFTFTSLVMLVASLGVSAGLFTVFDAIFLRPWPVPHAGRVVVAQTPWMADRAARRAAGKSGPVVRSFASDGLPYAFWPDLAEATNAAFTFVAPESFRVSFTASTGLPVLQGAFVSDNFLEVMQLPLQLGPGFSAQNAGPGARAVLTDATWRRYYGANPTIVGSSTSLGGVTTSIVGVLAPGLAGLTPETIDVLVPASGAGRWPLKGLADALRTSDPNDCCLNVSGRLRPGASRVDAEKELSFLLERYAARRATPPSSVRLRSTAAIDQRGITPGAAVMFGLIAAGSLLLLLLACANVWNLQLARALERIREVAVRLALGADRSRVVRQFLTEGMMLGAVAGALALLIAWALPPLVMRQLSPGEVVDFTPRWTVYAFVEILALGASLMFSLTPALHVTRDASLARRVAPAARARRMRGALLTAQIALSAVLVVTAALLSRSVWHALNGRADFAVGELSLVTVVAPTDDPNYNDHLQLRAAWARVRARVESDGVAFGVVMQPPLGARIARTTATADNGRAVQAQAYAMASSGLAIMDVPILAGRAYSDQIEAGEVVVNEELAGRLWPGTSPLGRTVDLDYPTKGRHTVVGVARNAHLLSFGRVQPMAHVALPRSVPMRLEAVVRRGATSEQALRAAVAGVDPALSVNIVPLSSSVRAALRDAISGARIATALGALATCMAIAGVFGVFSFSVEERRQEIGLRLALGANHAQIRGATVRMMHRPIVAGLAAGALLSAVAVALLRGYLLGISPLDPLTYLCVAIVLIASGAAATYLPLRRALRVDPATTLRAD